MPVLIDRGADLSVTSSSMNFESRFAESVLSTALYAGAMGCAHVLLPTERRATHLDQALYMEFARNDVDFVPLLLDIARPSTSGALLNCISKTSCPLMLDLLLSQCDEGFDFGLLNLHFPEPCRRNSADMISVFLAHGIDNGNRWESLTPLVGALTISTAAGLDIARVLVENGIELAPRRSMAQPLLTWLEYCVQDPARARSRPFHEAGRDFLIAHGLRHYE